MSQSASRLPTPNTVCVRVALKVHRVQAATRARNSLQSLQPRAPRHVTRSGRRRTRAGARAAPACAARRAGRRDLGSDVRDAAGTQALR